MVFDVEVILFPRGQDKRLAVEDDLKDEGRDEVRAEATLFGSSNQIQSRFGWFIWIVRILPRNMQKFWFDEPDTESNWLVNMVWHGTMC